MIPPAYSSTPRPADVNYDERAVPSYELPELLVCADGTPARSRELWFERRRPELVSLFENEVYGRAPAGGSVTTALVSREPRALAGLATRLELDVNVAGASPAASLTLRLLIYMPSGAKGPVPVFLGSNALGNHSVHADPAIRLAHGWVPSDPARGIHGHEARGTNRGTHARHWPLELMLDRGYALATFYAGDVDPDYPDGFRNGAHALFREAGAAEHAPDAWGSIAAWAWGLSRALDALRGIEQLDPRAIGVVGHSRLGKAALWAAALDPRFAWAIASGSGHGGAALSRRCFGERVHHLNQRFPHWFAGNFRRYDEREHDLPLDQHALIALIAPRPVYVASAVEDLWADPRGELLGCVHASPAFELCGVRGIDALEDPPPLDRTLGDGIGYHLRPGGHDLLPEDWRKFLDFIDRRRARGNAERSARMGGRKHTEAL